LTDWRVASISEKLRVTLDFLAKLTDAPDHISSRDLVPMRRNGVTERAVVDAIYICVGFNIINRIADALDFKTPPAYVFGRGTKFMRIFGYRMMSGSWLGSNGSHPALRTNDDTAPRSNQLVDPYDNMMTQLKHAVFFGPGTLDVALRKAVGSGAEMPSVLGLYVSKVAQRDYEGMDKNILDLRRDGLSDDQIFEATVSASLGAGVRRLEMALTALKYSH
jgi:hypothetical protein